MIGGRVTTVITSITGFETGTAQEALGPVGER
jgi:hypothetical protein